MESIICDIAKNHMTKDFNVVFKDLGLFVTAIRFDESNGFSVVIEISGNDGVLAFTEV